MRLIDAEKTSPEMAREVVARVRALYAIERQAEKMTTQERLQMRQKESAPLLTELRHRLLSWKEQLLPQYPMAEAIQYALSQ